MQTPTFHNTPETAPVPLSLAFPTKLTFCIQMRPEPIPTFQRHWDNGKEQLAILKSFTFWCLESCWWTWLHYWCKVFSNCLSLKINNKCYCWEMFPVLVVEWCVDKRSLVWGEEYKATGVLSPTFSPLSPCLWSRCWLSNISQYFFFCSILTHLTLEWCTWVKF